MNRPFLSLAALAFAASPGSALDLPPHKPGLWEMKMALGGGAPGVTINRCTDAETDTLVTTLAAGWADQSCAKHDIKREGNRMVIDSNCTVGGSTASAHAEIIGSFDESYTLTVTTTQDDGKPGSKHSRNIKVDAKWLGVCPAGRKPGDIMLPGGITMNVRNFRTILGLAPPK